MKLPDSAYLFLQSFTNVKSNYRTSLLLIPFCRVIDTNVLQPRNFKQLKTQYMDENIYFLLFPFPRGGCVVLLQFHSNIPYLKSIIIYSVSIGTEECRPGMNCDIAKAQEGSMKSFCSETCFNFWIISCFGFMFYGTYYITIVHSERELWMYFYD